MLRSVHKLGIFRPNSFRILSSHIRHFSESSTTTNQPPEASSGVSSGLAKALGKFRELERTQGRIIQDEGPPQKDDQSFLSLLRNSEFVRLGDPQGKVLIGKIFQVVNTDLYIDFGGKFYCVCRRPKRNTQLFVRNAEVKVRINELELCARFLGATEDLTLTEASGTLLDLVSTPVSSNSANKMEIKEQLQ
ncbi:hypothetical protein JTE90_024138 [Oedothorax gibbosus]|uniref:28S ribosomal protein S28, mitochondrial n=1 Tax=Oedothorax gibbosus TaxID=931172 RepID=A0AAV6U6M9_9ARAC|nr:hypothetical protein JTE90_024138 [Oedothorax gibbosus]